MLQWLNKNLCFIIIQEQIKKGKTSICISSLLKEITASNSDGAYARTILMQYLPPSPLGITTILQNLAYIIPITTEPNTLAYIISIEVHCSL